MAPEPEEQCGPTRHAADSCYAIDLSASLDRLDRIRANYERLAENARGDLQLGLVDTNVPDVESKKLSDL